jgi:MFS family permease
MNKKFDGSGYAYVIAAVAAFALIVSNGLSTVGIPVFYKAIREEFVALGAVPASGAETFIANGANLTFLLSGVFSMIGGWMIVRFGLKRLMVLGCVCLGAGLVIHSQATGVAGVYFSRVLMGASLGFVGVTPNVVLVSAWFREKRGTALGLVLTGTSLGGVLIPLVAAPLIMHLGWRAALLAVSLIVWLMLLPAVVFLVRERPDERSSEETDKTAAGMTLGEAVRTPVFWIFGLCAALVFYPIFVTSQQFNLYLQTPKIGFSLEAAAWAQSLLFVMSVGGKFAAGYLSDRFAAGYVMLGCCLLMFLATVVLLHLNASTAMVFLLPFGLGYGGTFVMLQRLAADYFGLREYGKILGTITLLEVIGAAVGGRLTGYLADLAGGDYTFAFYGVIVAAAAATACVLILLKVNRRGAVAV